MTNINLFSIIFFVYTSAIGQGIKPDLNYDPMTSDTSSPKFVQRGSDQRYIITETRLREIRKIFMYPYYDKSTNDNKGDYLTEIGTSTPKVHKNLNFYLPFFGFRFNYTRVSLNGFLEFSDPPRDYEYPLVFPVKEWPKKKDPSFIGIFYSKCRIGNLKDDDIDRRKPGVYFRTERNLRTRIDRMGVEIRERLKWDIRDGVIGSDNFEPRHAIIVTWKNISFYGGTKSALNKTNTFQMVLATDEVFTYAIFNYVNIDWTSHTEAGGDASTGENGVPAFVGFNAGNGTRSFEYQPYSQNSEIKRLLFTGFTNGFKGRHIFRIDENILHGSCDNDPYAHVPLVIAPESGNMLGGAVVNITGPCFGPDDQISCEFGVADPVDGYVADTNRAICVQPMLYDEGWVTLRVRIKSKYVIWKGHYYVESPASAAQKIYFQDQQYHEKSPSEIRIRWNKNNLTTNQEASIRLSLWGYSESTNGTNFVYITDLEDNFHNTGEYFLIPSLMRRSYNTLLDDIKFGFIQINLTESIKINTHSYCGKTVEITPSIWSRPIPLGWYFHFHWEKKYGSDWPRILCEDWLEKDRHLKNFTNELPQCPCTLEQALADKGRFMPDMECDKDSYPDCYYNKPAVHCVKTGSPSFEGAEQQCCYDRNHYLMLSYDQEWGSSPRRCHNLGKTPYNNISTVPTLSQWYNDVMPKYICCLWQEEQSSGCEHLRFERRPTQDCVSYQGPGVAGVFGDPHFVTFDDVQYTFNGKGEFVLVKSKMETDNIEVQGRFQEMSPNTHGDVRATQLTAVVARGNNSVIIEVRQRPLDSKWRYGLDIIAHGRRLFFDKPSMKVQHLRGVTVYTPTYILNQSEVVIMFDNGAGVEVFDNRGFMAARVYLPRSFINKTFGLLGNWSFNQKDDFTLPNGQMVPIVNNISDMGRVYSEFGTKWMIDDSFNEYKGRSLFYYDFGRTASTYNNLTYEPEFSMLPEDIISSSQEIKKAYAICSNREYECLYDYAMNLNRYAAQFTLDYKSSITKLKETIRTKIVSCGVLPTPRFGRKSTFLFIPGTKVWFECKNNFGLVGDSQRVCQANGTWNIPEYGYTKCLSPEELSQDLLP